MLYKCRDVMLLYPHHAGLGAEALEAAYGMMEGDERLRIASVDLLPGEAGVVQQLKRLLSQRQSERQGREPGREYLARFER
jgi:5-methylcytosine-specific restriction enzyme subunit McrC